CARPHRLIRVIRVIRGQRLSRDIRRHGVGSQPPPLPAEPAMTSVPTLFRVIAIAAFAWNLTGVAMFFLQTGLGPEEIAALPEAQRTVYEAMPSWLAVFYGIAVFGGVI